MKYYLCAYGHLIRLAGKVNSEAEAAREAFGTTHAVTVLEVGTRHPKYFNKVALAKLREQLKTKHRSETGYHLVLH